MRTTSWISRLMLAALLTVLVPDAGLDAQGKGKDKDKGGDDKRGMSKSRGDKGNKSQGRPERGRGGEIRELGKDVRRSERGNARASRRVEGVAGGSVERGRGNSDFDSDRRKAGRGRFSRAVLVEDLRPALRPFFVIDRAPQRVLVGAVSRAHLRGLDDDALVIRPLNDRVHLLNRSGTLLLDLDDDRARKVGRWEVLGVRDRVSDGAPAFCRSGAGHPVFGREWCLDKGFGLGAYRDSRWGRTRLENVVFSRRVNAVRLPGSRLFDLLGPTVFDRLALHAITLGLVEPLMGTWLDDPGGPRVLLLTSGDRPVAELVDRDRDDRPEVLLVARRDW